MRAPHLLHLNPEHKFQVFHLSTASWHLGPGRSTPHGADGFIDSLPSLPSLTSFPPAEHHGQCLISECTISPVAPLFSISTPNPPVPERYIWPFPKISEVLLHVCHPALYKYSDPCRTTQSTTEL